MLQCEMGSFMMLYGTDLMGSLPKKDHMMKVGSRGIKYARDYLDKEFPLKNYSWKILKVLGFC